MPKSSSFTCAVGRHEDVRRLEVAVDDQVLVRVAHRLARRRAKSRSRSSTLEPTRVAVLGDRLALDVLHGEPRPPVVRDAAVEQPGDVRMVQPGEDLPLGEEAPADLVGVQPVRERA